MKLIFRGLLSIAIAAVTLPAFAHHSFAMFDGSKKTTVEGTVKRFQWTNPHSWIYLTATDASGLPQEWPIELGSPNGLVRQGWNPRTLTPGMKVKVTIHPLKDGNAGGQFLSVTLPDGTQFGSPDHEPTPTE